MHMSRDMQKDALSERPLEFFCHVMSRRKDHNEALDQGMKFEMSYRSPSIFSTDLFNVNEFGCIQMC